MKYSKRKDKYCNNVLNDNFHEIDERLNSLEKNGGGGSGGSGSEPVYITQAEYNALPDSKLTNDVEYRITDGAIGAVKASNVKYDNSFTGLQAVNLQGAVDEVIESLVAENSQPFQFAYDSESGKYGYKAKVEGADTFFPFSSGEIKNILHYQFGGSSGNKFVQLNCNDFSVECGTISSGSASEYTFPNYKYDTSKHYGDIVSVTGGEFIIIYDKGLEMTTTTTIVQTVKAQAGETIFSKQTGSENFRVIVVKLN